MKGVKEIKPKRLEPVDEELLLTPEEIQSTFQDEISVKGGGFWKPTELTQLQAEKVSRILEARCQQRIEGIFREAESPCPHGEKAIRRECGVCWHQLRKE